VDEERRVSDWSWRRERAGRRVTRLNSIKRSNFMCLITTIVNQYKNYIQKHNACKEDETIELKPEKIENKMRMKVRIYPHRR